MLFALGKVPRHVALKGQSEKRRLPTKTSLVSWITWINTCFPLFIMLVLGPQMGSRLKTEVGAVHDDGRPLYGQPAPCTESTRLCVCRGSYALLDATKSW